MKNTKERRFLYIALGVAGAGLFALAYMRPEPAPKPTPTKTSEPSPPYKLKIKNLLYFADSNGDHILSQEEQQHLKSKLHIGHTIQGDIAYTLDHKLLQEALAFNDSAENTILPSMMPIGDDATNRFKQWQYNVTSQCTSTQVERVLEAYRDSFRRRHLGLLPLDQLENKK